MKKWVKNGKVKEEEDIGWEVLRWKFLLYFFHDPLEVHAIMIINQREKRKKNFSLVMLQKKVEMILFLLVWFFLLFCIMECMIYSLLIFCTMAIILLFNIHCFACLVDNYSVIQLYYLLCTMKLLGVMWWRCDQFTCLPVHGDWWPIFVPGNQVC